uniref:Uncharacterized protein n=1 Tax=Nelumbo nucifera TaxID=4432 RepID=A0A822Y2G9_NELNU|nr:TPA_asm: hypothetical protein HUJ06_027920 [Nelumbo nucifera]
MASSNLYPADELFYKGHLLPLHLSPRLSMVRTLLLASSSSSSCSDSTTTASRDSIGSSNDSSSSFFREVLFCVRKDNNKHRDQENVSGPPFVKRMSASAKDVIRKCWILIS